MNSKKIISLLLCLCMIFSAIAANMSVAYAQDKIGAGFEKTDGTKFNIDLTQNKNVSSALEAETIAPDEDVRVLIIMEDKSVIEENGQAVVNDETLAKSEELISNQEAVAEKIGDTVLDGELDVRYNYTWLLNGVSAKVPYGKLDEIRAVDGVKSVLLQPVYEVCKSNAQSVASPLTINDGSMIGRENTWADGYTGKGIKIAVVDTGLDTDHQNFGPLSASSLTADSATKNTVSSVLSSLKASQRYKGLTADDVYYSTKVAYGFNYCDNDLDITHDNDTEGDHGTHVAGIAASNDLVDGGVVGVAPEAQLYIMKVFGKNGGAYTDDILAALEDALTLGADVVNMSLGSPAGFTSDGAEIDKIYARAASTNTILSISAGNSYTLGYNNAWGLNKNLADYPDNATFGSPASYNEVISVASVENTYIQTLYIDANGLKIMYSEGSYGANEPMSTLFGRDLQIVPVPGAGEVTDFAGLDVTGKIALVQRGSISFVDKVTNAANAGAIACLVYNNEAGTINMNLEGCEATIPAASITQANGEFLVAAYNADKSFTISFSSETAAIPNDQSYQMDDFSSWGVAPDLSLEPDITAPGGNIYSTLDGGKYGLMSGTSMAAPNVAGISALVMQYAKANFGKNANLHTIVGALLTSTAVPLNYQSTDLLFSPRQQGSGLANAFNAVRTEAYLSVEGSDTPKASLKDDPSRAGKYEFTYTVNNFGKRDLFYDLSTNAQTEWADDTTPYAQYGVYFMGGAPKALDAATSESSSSMTLVHDVNNDGVTGSHDAYLIYRAAVAKAPENANWEGESFRYNVNNNEEVNADDVQAYLDALVGKTPANVDLEKEVLRVKAGSTADVTVNVALTDSDKAYMEDHFVNGIYVEGFSMLTAKNSGGVDLSLPYLAFYGDWRDAPVIDTGFYWDESLYGFTNENQYLNILWTQAGSDLWQPGLNPYINDEPFDFSHISLSPNGDGYCDYIDDIYVSLLRNAATLSIKYIDMNTKNVYDSMTFNNARKSCYSDANGVCLPFVLSFETDDFYKVTDKNGTPLANNTQLILDIAATIDYDGAEPEHWLTPITVDTEEPTLLDFKYRVVDGKTIADITFVDNVGVAALMFITSDGSSILGAYSVEDPDFGDDGYRTYNVSVDVTDYGNNFVVALGDYAVNEAYYTITLQ